MAKNGGGGAPCANVPLSSAAALNKSQTEADVMKKQMDGLAREYDRLLKEHQELQVVLSSKHSRVMICWVVRNLNVTIQSDIQTN